MIRIYLLCIIFAISCVTSAANKTIYLSSRGSDSGDGTIAHPFYSLNKAIEGKLSETASDTLFVIVQSGDYYMDRPFTLYQSSSRPIVIKSQEGEKPRFIGGISIKGWEKFGDKLYRAYIPEVLQFGFSFEQFYVNGERAVLARTPNENWYEVESSAEKPLVKGIRCADYAVQRINFHPEDWSTLANASSNDLTNLKFRFYHKWSITHKPAEFVQQDSAFIYTGGTGMHPWNPIQKGSRYIMYDYMAALDNPGEWYLDRAQGYIYYMPREVDDMSSVSCFAPTLKQWVIFQGKADAPVKNIHFNNLSFQFSSYLMPKQGEKPEQAAVEADAAMTFDYSENINFIDCELMYTGAYAMWFRQECHNNRVDHCYLANLGGGGIKIGEPYYRNDRRQVTHGNVVNNTIITHVGTELPSAVGIAILQSSDNQITHNEISDLRYSGISVGWVWGYNNSMKVWTWGIGPDGKSMSLQARIINPAVRNIIEYNHIHHIGWGELSDMGAIYTLGESQGTRISHNVIHDVWSYDYGGWGLYTDEGSSDIELSYNLVYRCKSGGFHQHYGRNNKIENNIFAFGHYYQIQYTRPETHQSFSFKHNIILYDKGEVLVGPGWKSGKIDMDKNMYWGINGESKFAEDTFSEWNKRMEPHSIQADPMFLDVMNDNYGFKSTKNIRKIGFKTWDYSKSGLYGSESWKQKAPLSDKIMNDFRKAVSLRMNK